MPLSAYVVLLSLVVYAVYKVCIIARRLSSLKDELDTKITKLQNQVEKDIDFVKYAITIHDIKCNG